MIEQIVNKLASRPTNNLSVNNFYRGNDKESQNRLNNIAKYLAFYENNPPKYILIGEAPGYKGCAKSGIPFTSLHIISSLDFLNKTTQLLGGKEKERTSTIVWDLIGQIAEPPMLWNAFPFHPHKNNSPKSNRKPNIKEIQEGLEYIKKLIKIFPNAKLIAVGNVAYESLIKFDLPVDSKVRHPSFGGKAAFNEQITKILTK